MKYVQELQVIQMTYLNFVIKVSRFLSHLELLRN